jgi:FHS family Na+ dependent glucose MFS transporter 1
MNGLHFFFGAGAFVAPLIIARLLPAGGGVTWAYWALAVLALPAMAWLVRLPSPPPEIESQANPARNTPPRLVLLFALLFFLYVGGEVSFGGWVFTYAVALDLGGAAAAAYLTSAFWGAFTAGRLLAIPVAARVRPRHLLLGSFAGCLASLAAVLLWPASTVALWAGALGLGLSMAPVFPASFSLAERHMTITGQVSGWFLVGASLGAMSLPWLIGQLFERVGPHVTMLAILIDVILTLGVFAALLLHLGRRAPEQQAAHL